MSRELEKVDRVEEKKFSAPAPVQRPVVKEKEPDSVRWLSDGAVEAAARRLRHFYPKETQELARAILEAAAPHMKAMKRATSKSITADAIDAAGEAIYIRETKNSDWNTISDRLQWVYKEDAKGVLETVVLHLNISSK